MSPRQYGTHVGLITAVVAGWLVISCSSDSHAPSERATTTAASSTHDRRHHGGDGGAPSPNTNPIVSDFVLYAERSVKIGKGDQVLGGDVGVAVAATTGFGP